MKDDYRDTLLAYYDIVGYSAYVEEKGMEEVKAEMHRFVEAAKNSGANMRGLNVDLKIDVWIVSDSIVFVLDTSLSSINATSAKWFLATCSLWLASSLVNFHIPLRGAIGAGDFYKSGEVLVSTALVDAAHHEKKQDWLGAALTPKAVERVTRLQTDLLCESIAFVGKGKIPSKDGSEKEGYYIKPTIFQTGPDWARIYLPSWFDREKKKEMIRNSDRLYGAPNVGTR
jgi:hypothetical protein